jgi:hypothetical protein
MIGLLAILAPLSYLAGRVSTAALAHTYFAYLGSGLALGATGAMVGIPIGLFFGAFRGGPTASASPARTNTLKMEHDILSQLRDELAQNQALFDARKGSTSMFARIDYITAFWSSIKASGRLFVMQDATLLGTIAMAYYWLDQASNLEQLAYRAKYAQDKTDTTATAQHLISETRLLDNQIATSVTKAIAAIDSALRTN